ncbi:DedA family protein [Streptomyces pacificus]|uniref:VTT domain-containing protein n=1 Tax=Streptomyces pacificus TaxID=2705029 RepID=A0A6A0AR41_9ACTN|nr:VTT domain-containing protein [Streptomyces pacificus]GFH34364.1 hypothetical protein SCWH03_05780 [Streptomyces pacificus]
MFEAVGLLLGSPWIYAIVALSVLLDVFLPVLPSGALVITAATAAAAGTTTAAAGATAAGQSTVTGPAAIASAAVQTSGDAPSVPALLLCAATASVLGDLVAYRLARRGGERLNRAIARSRRLVTARERLGTALGRSGGLLVVIARFAPAGRSVVSLGAGAAHHRVREFLPWSALAAVAWAGYSVGLGWFGGQWLGATWVGVALSVAALFAAGSVAAYVIRRPAPKAA